MVCFIESLAESETPLEITELSSGSIRFSMFAITLNPRSMLDFRVDTNSSETPPPLLRQLTVAETAEERRKMKLCRENGVGVGVVCSAEGFGDRSVTRERMKARAAAAM